MSRAVATDIRARILSITRKGTLTEPIFELFEWFCRKLRGWTTYIPLLGDLGKAI